MHELFRHKDHQLEELVGADDLTPEEFLRVKQEIKAYYSQPSIPQAKEHILKHADAIIFEHPFTILRGEEMVSYDDKGRPIKKESSGSVTIRRYDEKGFITEETYTEKDDRHGYIEEVRTFTYGFERGKIAAQKVRIDEYVKKSTKEKRVATRTPFVINLADVDPFHPSS